MGTNRSARSESDDKERFVVIASGIALVLLSIAYGPSTVLLPVLLVATLAIGTTVLFRKHALERPVLLC